MTADESDVSPGAIYKEEIEKLRSALKWPEGAPVDARLATEDGYYVRLDLRVPLPQIPPVRGHILTAHWLHPVP